MVFSAILAVRETSSNIFSYSIYKTTNQYETSLTHNHGLNPLEKSNMPTRPPPPPAKKSNSLYRVFSVFLAVSNIVKHLFLLFFDKEQ